MNDGIIKDENANNDDDEDEGIDEEPETENSKFLKAAENCDLDLLQDLLSQNPNLINSVDSDGYTPLHRAAYCSDSASIPVINFLINRGSDLGARTKTGWTPLHSAARWNCFQNVKLLLQKGADVNALSDGGCSPLHIASENRDGKETLTILLLHPSINVSLCTGGGDSAYHIAQRSGPLSYLFKLSRDSINIF